MTVLAGTPIADLERDVARASRAALDHARRCPSGCCKRCVEHIDAVTAATERLAAARSQIPVRHIFPDRATGALA